MPSGYKNPEPCPICEVKIEPTQNGLFHCNTHGCKVSHFRKDRFGRVYDIVYCGDVEEERVVADL